MTSVSPTLANTTLLVRRLIDLLGAERVSVDPDERRMLSSDLFYEGETASCIIRPADKESLCAALALVSAEGVPIFPRGGGLSYSGGYTPAQSPAVLVDLRCLDRIIAVNAEDMHVTVEAGVTWKALRDRLSPLGLRTPFWGTFSGLHATIGGSLAQGAVFFGSGHTPCAANAVLALEIALPDGRLLKTSSGSNVQQPTPFFRYDGPDLTGVFLGDCGALGIKVAATLQLEPAPAAESYAAFAFDDEASMRGTMSQISRTGLASECFAFDPGLLRLRTANGNLAENLGVVAGVARAPQSLGDRVRAVAAIAAAGQRFAPDHAHVLSVVAEGEDHQHVARRTARVDEIAASHGAVSIPATMARVARLHPFQPVNRILGHNGERWTVLHAITPHSRADEALQIMHTLLAEQASAIQAHRIEHGHMTATLGRSSFLIEPNFLWPDTNTALHKSLMDPGRYSRLPKHAPDPDARTVVRALMSSLIERWRAIGVVHLQVGRKYPFMATREPTTAALLQAVKTHLDPKGVMNPGVLGF